LSIVAPLLPSLSYECSSLWMWGRNASHVYQKYWPLTLTLC
jgi:hypothetical protein